MTCGGYGANRPSNGSPGTHRYRPTPHGRAITVLATKTYGRVLTPGLTAFTPGPA
jgi:hypothetical protein